jgi:hypothetical protein
MPGMVEGCAAEEASRVPRTVPSREIVERSYFDMRKKLRKTN